MNQQEYVNQGLEFELEALTPDQRQSRLEKAIEKRRMLQQLLEYPPFQLYQLELNKQREERVKAVLGLVTGLDSVFKSNYTSGECAGIQLASELPKLLIEFCEADIAIGKRMIEENKEEDEEDGRSSPE